MTDRPLDVLVADGDLGSLATGYLLARRGRSVGVVDLSTSGGTTTVAATAARRLDLRALVEAAPVVTRRTAKVLQPEGMLGVEFLSERLSDAGNAVVVVERSDVCDRLSRAISALGGQRILGAGVPEIDATGFVAGYRSPDGTLRSARCTLLGQADVEVITGFPGTQTSPHDRALESEWTFALDADLLAARFGLSTGEAAEWWLQGDPFDGASGLARLRAFAETVTLGIVVPLADVQASELGIADLAERLRHHPGIAPLLVGTEPTGVTGRTLPLFMPPTGPSVGDGWVAAPQAIASDPQPLTTELRMAEALADVLDAALASPRISSARLAVLRKRLRALEAAASPLPLDPIDAWADELVTDATGLLAAARLLADRFPSAG